MTFDNINSFNRTYFLLCFTLVKVLQSRVRHKIEEEVSIFKGEIFILRKARFNDSVINFGRVFKVMSGGPLCTLIQDLFQLFSTLTLSKSVVLKLINALKSSYLFEIQLFYKKIILLTNTRSSFVFKISLYSLKGVCIR